MIYQPMSTAPTQQERLRAIIRYMEPRLEPDERLVLVQWAQHLLSIRHSDATYLQKARRSIVATFRGDVIVSLLSGPASSLKDIAWDDRSWSARLGLGAAAVTAATFGGKGAGIAAMGSAVGVPLWIVLGAGGSFAGMLIDELSKAIPSRKPASKSGASAEIVDAEWEFVADPPQIAARSDAARSDAALAAPSESLLRVFREAYREARLRQRDEDADRETPH